MLFRAASQAYRQAIISEWQASGGVLAARGLVQGKHGAAAAAAAAAAHQKAQCSQRIK